ncbi:MAG: YCF48-related protein [Acidobacteria bacterium]|nr:YCF48-related protein [Acidobacteriota bacterium]
MKVPKTILRHSLGCLLAALLFSFTARAQGNSFSIQIASATTEAEAKAIATDLRAKGIDAYWVKAEVPGKGTRYRVRIGRFSNQPDAKTMADRTRNRGLIKEFIITNYDAPPTRAAPPGEMTDRTTTSPKSTEKTRDKAAGVSARDPINNESATNKTAKKTELKSVEKKEETDALARPIESSEKKKSQRTPPIASETTRAPSSRPTSQPEVADSNKIDTNIASPPVADAIIDFAVSNNNWKVVRRSSETDKNLRAIHFVDAMTGWAGGDAGAVYRTTDGGRSWKPLLSGAPADINYIYFVDWNNGWMLGESGGRGAGKGDGDGQTLLFITNNGGRTWTNKPMPNILSLHFIDAKNGWAVGKDATVLRTKDGGEQWSPLPGMEKLVGLPVESSTYNYGFCDVFFLDANHGWMIGNFYGRARSNIGGLFVTSDGGSSWKRIPLTLQTQYTSGRFTPGLLHSVNFTDLNTGSVTGEMSDGEARFFFVLHTRDGGKTWEQFRRPSRAIHSTQFLNPSNGWSAAFAPREGGAEAVIYDTTLMRTDNGGMSWQNDFVARGRRIRGVFFISPTKGWAVGDRGMILCYDEKLKAN